MSNTLNIDVTEMTAGENFQLLFSPEYLQSLDDQIFHERNIVSLRLCGGGGGFDTQVKFARENILHRKEETGEQSNGILDGCSTVGWDGSLGWVG